MDKQVYLPDEFDEAAKDIPAGMHRMPVKRWHTLLPLVLILILVPLLAWGGVSLIQMVGDSNQAATSKQESSTVGADKSTDSKTEAAKKAEEEKKKAEEEAKKAEEEKKKAEEEAKKAAEVKKDLRIEVLNAGTRAGYAGQTASQLKNEGYTNAAASRNQLPQGVTNPAVVYRNEEAKATAQKVAEILGISDVRQSDALTPNVMITVVVR